MKAQQVMKYVMIVCLFVFTMLLLTRCFAPTEEGKCDGHMEVAHPIPDTTMVLGQTIERDLTAEPVFRQTAGNGFSYNVLNQNWFIVDVQIGDITGLVLKARGVGIDTIAIEAKDICDTHAKTTFVVKVDSASK
ncbi:MAG TPA: hypothetical protein VKA08_11570 [Balneolales bacterium]|nr:hypothetical protein [Balneolales bacterium]